MPELNYQRTVIGYHGCDASVVTSIIGRGRQLAASENAYDWLGRGIYFWEYGPQRAFEWAVQQARLFGKIRKPAVLGALIQLGNCFDLLDTVNTRTLAEMYPLYRDFCRARDIEVPRNRSVRTTEPADWVLRYLDCAMLNWCLGLLEEQTRNHFHTVRSVFVEGEPAFPGSKIMARSHIQIAVRDHGAIVGYFKPNIDSPSR